MNAEQLSGNQFGDRWSDNVEIEPDVIEAEMNPSTETALFLNESAHQPLFRLFPLNRFYELVEKHEMALVHVSNWEDTNEAFRYLTGLMADDLPGGSVSTFHSYATLFGQCWSLNDAEELCYPWNFYGDKSQLVQVETSVMDLWKAVTPSFSTTKNPRVFCLHMGKVKYRDYLKIKSHEWLFEETMKLGNDLIHKRFMDSLYVKNKPYRFEKEVRIVYDDVAFQPEDHRPQLQLSGLVQLHNICLGFIHRVTASPFMSKKTFLNLQVRMTDVGLPHLLQQSRLFA